MMYSNSTRTSVPPNASKTPLFFCPKEPEYQWNLDHTVIPWNLATILLLASPFTIFLNASVIIAVRKRKDLQRRSNIVISSMAIADLLVGAMSMPISAAVDLLVIHQVFLGHVCTLNTTNIAMADCFLFSSIFHLVVMAWERYMAIRKWKDYMVVVTSERLKKLAAFAWMGALFLAVPLLVKPGFGVDYDYREIWYVVIPVSLGFSITLIVYLYIMVFLGVRQRRTSEISRVDILVQAKLESKVAKTTALITAALLLTVASGGALLVLGDSFPVFRENAAFRIAETLLLSNSIINPLIYCYRDRRFRNAVLELLRIRKPVEIHRMEAAVRFHRGKERLYPVKNVQLPIQDAERCLKESSFRDRSASDYRVHKTVTTRERSMSAPSLRRWSSQSTGKDNLPPSKRPPNQVGRTS